MILSQKYSAAGDFAQKSKGGEGNCTGSRKEESGRRLMCECCVQNLSKRGLFHEFYHILMH